MTIKASNRVERRARSKVRRCVAQRGVVRNLGAHGKNFAKRV